VKIVWDEVKRQSNLDKHGLDFAELTEGFFMSSVIVPAEKGRSMAIGALSSGVIAVVFLRLGREGLSVINMRPASAKERKVAR
jgi:uncharacterized DUF497 family protein